VSDVATTLQALQTIIGGVSSPDLTPSGRVRLGRPGPADGAVPMAWLAISRLETQRSAEIGSYDRRLFVDIEVRVSSTASTPDARELAAAEAVDAVITALQAAPNVGACLDSTMTGTTIDGDEFGLSGVAIAFIVWEGWWISTSGEGT
jgi:hypothetical protein